MKSDTVKIEAKPLAAMNEWSCALACVVTVANDVKIKITQEEICERYSAHFPEWQERIGGLTRIGVLRLLELLGLNHKIVKFVLITNNLEEFQASFLKMEKESRSLATFVLLHTPTNHCLRLFGLNAEGADVLDPAPLAPRRGFVTWEVLKTRDPEFVLLAQ